MSKPSFQQNQIQNSKEATIQNSKEIPNQNSKEADQNQNSKEADQNQNSKEEDQSQNSKEADQNQNSKDAQNQNSKESDQNQNSKEAEQNPNSKGTTNEDENKLVKGLFEQEEEDKKKSSDKTANQITESGKKEKKNKTPKTISLNIIVPEERIIDLQSKKHENNKKKISIKKEKKENSINCGLHEPNALLENKYLNHIISIEEKKTSSDYLNKKRKREIKIDEKPKNVNKNENLGDSFGKSFDQFDTEDNTGYNYKKFKKKVKNSLFVKYKKTENSQDLKNLSKIDILPKKLGFYQEELIQFENIYLFPIGIDFLNINPNYNDSSDEELNLDIIRNVCCNHERYNRIYSQNLNMNLNLNYNNSLSYLSTNQKTN